MNETISTHAQFDDDRYWRFARSSGLPLNYFGRRRNFGVIVTKVGIGLACVVIVMLVI